MKEGCLEPLETQEWFIIVTPFVIGIQGLGKGNPFWICLEDVFYKGLNKKSFFLEALTVSDLQRGLEAQAFEICLLKLFAIRKNY